MQEHAPSFDRFSLLGGPLHRLGRRLRLVRGDADTVPLGLALGWGLWGVLLLLALMEGVTHQLFSLSVIGGHVRLLLVIPLLFVCESLVEPRLAGFVQTIVRSGVVTSDTLPALKSEISRITRWKEAWLPEALCLLAAALFPLAASRSSFSGTTVLDAGHALSDLPLMGQWYWVVCLTLFRFLLLRWVWRLVLWCYFLWRLSRLPLKLVPTHPDYAGGLGYLEVVQAHFTPLVFAISAMHSAILAEDISSGRAPFEAVYPTLAFILAVDAILFLGPPFIFTAKLWACRIKGMSDYMVFASDYVRDFDQKWLNTPPPQPDSPLGTPDLQSLADLTNSVNVIRGMRLAPISVRLIQDLLIVAVLPMLPLLLFKYPIAELLQKFFSGLVGL